MNTVVLQAYRELTSCWGGTSGQASYQKLAAVIVNGAAKEVHCELPTSTGTDTGQEAAHIQTVQWGRRVLTRSSRLGCSFQNRVT